MANSETYPEGAGLGSPAYTPEPAVLGQNFTRGITRAIHTNENAALSVIFAGSNTPCPLVVVAGGCYYYGIRQVVSGNGVVGLF